MWTKAGVIVARHKEREKSHRSVTVIVLIFSGSLVLCTTLAVTKRGPYTSKGHASPSSFPSKIARSTPETVIAWPDTIMLTEDRRIASGKKNSDF